MKDEIVYWSGKSILNIFMVALAVLVVILIRFCCGFTGFHKALRFDWFKLLLWLLAVDAILMAIVCFFGAFFDLFSFLRLIGGP